MQFKLVKSSFIPLGISIFCWILIWIIWGFSWLLFFFILVLIFIYKNPTREVICKDKKAILAPIDGKIIALKNVSHQDLGECIELDIKNLIYETGVIRACANMQILKIAQRHGLFLPTSFELSSNFNERIFILAKNEELNFALRICAGSLDKKIKIDPIKEYYQAGEELGFTLNGKISLLLPKDSRLLVGLGDELKANSLLGYFS